MAALKRSPLTAPSITPPSLDRQHSYNAHPLSTCQPNDATTVLANVASRAASPKRKSSSNSALPSPSQHSSISSRRTSWEDCMQQGSGYISFPDFDALRAAQEEHAIEQ